MSNQANSPASGGRLARLFRGLFGSQRPSEVATLTEAVRGLADAVARDGESTRRAVAGLGDDLTRGVAGQADQTRAAVVGQAELARGDVVREAEATRRTVVGQAEFARADVAREAEATRRAAAESAAVLEGRVEVARAEAEAARRAVAESAATTQAQLAAQADSTRAVVVGQAEMARADVIREAQATREAVVGQGSLARTDVIREAEVTREVVVGQGGLTRTEVLRLAEQIAGWGVDAWRINEIEGLLRYQRRKDYLAAIRSGELAVPALETDHPLAAYSNDTKHPRGSKNDNSICLRFNRKLYQLFPGRRPLRLLDLGCAGGGLVRSLLDDGHFAVGLDGSDYPLVNQTGEWWTIPHHLFTCDVTEPFRLTDAGTREPLRFDVITAWELMEHIPEDLLPQLLDNIDRHLAPGGYLFFSIATFVDRDEASGVVWHVTVKSPEWWADRFRQAGFLPVTDHPFGKNDWVRGSGNCRYDWHEDDGMGFHIALRRAADVPAQAVA